MIDNVTISLPMRIPIEPEEKAFEFNNLIYCPVYNKEGFIKRYDTDSSGLRLSYYPTSERLFINNSLHKAYHHNNYSDFTLSQLTETISHLSDSLSINVSAGKVVKIEYGCNIKVSDTSAVYNSLVSFRGKDFKQMSNRGYGYGNKCEFTQYAIKGYDKSYASRNEFKRDKAAQELVPDNLLRFEVAVKRSQYLHKRKQPIPIATVSDLLQPDKISYLCADLVEKYSQTIKGPIVSVSGLNLRQKTAYARMTVPIIKQDLKTNHPPTHADDRRLYRQINSGNAPEGNEDVRQKLIEKCQQLINS